MAMKAKSAARRFLDAMIGDPMTLGRFLRSHREDEGLSMSDMARELGIRGERLQAIEDDKGVVTLARAMQWARQLGYVEDLFVELVLQSKVSAAGLRLRVELTQYDADANGDGLIKSTLEQLRVDRAAGMPKTARFSAYTGVQLDAIEDVLSLLLEAEASGADALGVRKVPRR